MTERVNIPATCYKTYIQFLKKSLDLYIYPFKVWFKNRRARCRKVKRAKNSVSEVNAADNRKEENVNKTNEVVMDCSTKDQNTHKGLH